MVRDQLHKRPSSSHVCLLTSLLRSGQGGVLTAFELTCYGCSSLIVAALRRGSVAVCGPLRRTYIDPLAALECPRLGRYLSEST